MKFMKAPCSSCIRLTKHNVLHEEEYIDEVHFCTDGIERYAILQCAGCQHISFAHYFFSPDDEVLPDDEIDAYSPDGELVVDFYPSPVSRKKPSWWYRLENKDELLSDLLNEIYRAVDGGQYRLAAMGIRALLEQVMVAKVGDLKTFDEKLDAFQEKGYISLIQRDTMENTLEVGHAAMHRGFKPTEEELSLALDIVETIIGAIYHHVEGSIDLTKRVPPRSPKPGKADRT
jgi:hypothetical protein